MLRAEAEFWLANYYVHGAVLRTPSLKRRAREKRTYKKGYEIRLIVADRRELAQVRRLLRQAGFVAGRPYRKGSGWAQPIYGKDQVRRLLELVQSFGLADVRKQLARVPPGAGLVVGRVKRRSGTSGRST